MAYSSHRWDALLPVHYSSLRIAAVTEPYAPIWNISNLSNRNSSAFKEVWVIWGEVWECENTPLCNWQLLVLSYKSQDGCLHFIPTLPLTCFMVRPQYWLISTDKKHFVFSFEMSPCLISDVPWNQQLLTKQSLHRAEDARQRPLLGQSAGQQPTSTGEGRRWGYKIEVIVECEESFWLLYILAQHSL